MKRYTKSCNLKCTRITTEQLCRRYLGFILTQADKNNQSFHRRHMGKITYHENKLKKSALKFNEDDHEKDVARCTKRSIKTNNTTEFYNTQMPVNLIFEKKMLRMERKDLIKSPPFTSALLTFSFKFFLPVYLLECNEGKCLRKGNHLSFRKNILLTERISLFIKLNTQQRSTMCNI